MKLRRTYLDHAAAAPLREAAREPMLRLLGGSLANPSSPHLEGRAAKDVLEAARTRCAQALGCRPREVIFTAGGTEALAIALRGAAARAADAGRRRIVTSAIEYPAVLETADALAAEGFEVVRVPVDERGNVSAPAFLEAAGEDAAVAALMLANHEMGSVLPVRDVAAGLAQQGTPLVCDAALGPGRLACRPADLGAPLVAFSAQKFGGPPGVGLLYVRRGTSLSSWLRGGIQEERLRPGAENVLGCVGASHALAEACTETETRAAHCRSLIGTFLAGLGELEGWSRVGPDGTDTSPGLPGLVTLEIDDVEGEAAMINMDLEGFSVSTGSTCALGSSDPSLSLLAMGMSKKRAASTIRVSVGPETTSDDLERASATLTTIVQRLRALAFR